MDESKKKGMLYVISGPSGVGKGTVIKEILSRDKNLALSVSVTTRKPRNGEINGKDYYFVNKEDFDNRIKNKEFLEWAEVHGSLYGTLRKDIEDYLKNGRKVILEIDVNGAKQIMEKAYPKKTIFIMPPSEKELNLRLKNRNTDAEDTINRRLMKAEKEIDEKERYDFVVENKEVMECASEILKIINGN